MDGWIHVLIVVETDKKSPKESRPDLYFKQSRLQKADIDKGEKCGKSDNAKRRPVVKKELNGCLADA